MQNNGAQMPTPIGWDYFTEFRAEAQYTSYWQAQRNSHWCVCVRKDSGQIYVSPVDASIQDTSKDVGPFETFAEAYLAACALNELTS